ncbi:MAG: hypothetical protein EU981_05015 [Candidatus Liberibacter ctenarytainae]|uniref:Transmembrane protein n=1 Tax=Candidatus Liberibacter ctenarytainae TaxID=2020335 RepID=A0A937AJW3_9HYPH|nr:hypothetical protein [Candidatus Liberibacter ctenarytainae]
MAIPHLLIYNTNMTKVAEKDKAPKIQAPHSLTEYRLTLLEKIYDRLENKVDRLSDKMDARFERVDVRMERDFRFTFGALIAVALGLATMMANGFHWI